MTVRTCSRWWLRVNLPWLVTHDEVGKEEFTKFLNDIQAGSRVGPLQIAMAVEEFGKGDIVASVLFPWLVTPFYSWPKLWRLFGELQKQLG